MQTNPYRTLADQYLCESGKDPNDLSWKLAHERANALATLIENNPQVWIGNTHEGEAILDMSRAAEHPGSWGHKLSRNAQRSTVWILPGITQV